MIKKARLFGGAIAALFAIGGITLPSAAKADHLRHHRHRYYHYGYYGTYYPSTYYDTHYGPRYYAPMYRHHHHYHRSGITLYYRY